MIVLGLDPSTHTGWALVDDGRLVFAGVESLPGDHRATKALHYEGWLADQLRELAPDLVCYEHPMTQRGKSGVLLGGLVLMTEVACERAGLPSTYVWTGTLKKHATGDGHANKEAMIASACRELGYDPSEHEADAYWAARYALAHVREEEIAP